MSNWSNSTKWVVLSQLWSKSDRILEALPQLTGMVWSLHSVQNLSLKSMFKLASSQHNVNYSVDSTFRIFLQKKIMKREQDISGKSNRKICTIFFHLLANPACNIIWYCISSSGTHLKHHCLPSLDKLIFDLLGLTCFSKSWIILCSET